MERLHQESPLMNFNFLGQLPRVLVAITVIAALGMLPMATASAALLNIEFTGLDLAYDGTDIYDAGGAAGGDGSPANADELFTMTFEIDGNLVGTLESDIYADILIPDVALPAAGGQASSGGGGFFDLLTQGAVPYFGANLPIDTFDLLYTGFEIAVFGNGVATEAFNDLPFGAELVPGDQVSISFSAQIDELTDDGQQVTSFEASGTGEVRGNQIPEPTTLVSLLVALAGLALASRRK